MSQSQRTVQPLESASAMPKAVIDWRRLLRQWHWVSSALCMTGMLLFAMTGFVLNHEGDFDSTPVVSRLESSVPMALLAELAPAWDELDETHVLPAALTQWAYRTLDIVLSGEPERVSDTDLHISMRTPGADSWVNMNLDTGEFVYEKTDYGWLAYFNDLHTGRNTSVVWRWFVDIFAIACVIFSLTGFGLLWLHARRRPMTWPLTGLGLLVPILLGLLFMHA